MLFAPPQAGRNLAVVLAKQIPGPSRDTIEVAHLVELDGRWASLITQPDMVAAGGAGLRSLSDQRLHGDPDYLHARRQAELMSGATAYAPSGPPERKWTKNRRLKIISRSSGTNRVLPGSKPLFSLRWRGAGPAPTIHCDISPDNLMEGGGLCFARRLLSVQIVTRSYTK